MFFTGTGLKIQEFRETLIGLKKKKNLQQGKYQIVAFGFKYRSQITWIIFCSLRSLKMNSYIFLIFKFFSSPICD